MLRTRYGNITVSRRALAEIAARAALESYGVVGLARKNLSGGIINYLKGERLHKGVSLEEVGEGKVSLRLFVVVEFGVNLVEVSRNLIERVKYDIQKLSGYEVVNIDVIIQGVAE